MKDVPLISICIPAFQRKQHLGRLLDSIEIQFFRDFEVVITDDSPDIEIQDLVKTHPLRARIRYFKNQFILGSPENWNQGLRFARADWIKIMHDDDWFSGPDSLGCFAEAVKTGESAFYFSAYSNVYPNGHSKTTSLKSSYLDLLKQLPEILFTSNRIGPPSAVIFKRDDAVFFDNRMKWLVDVDFYIHYLKNHGPAKYIAKNLIHIGISESQITQASFGNPKIEIPERFMLAEKLDKTSIKNIRVFDAWWRFLRNLSVRDVSQIIAAGYQGPVPDFIPVMIKFQNKIPAGLLKIRIFSKISMSFCYLQQRKHL